LRPYLQASVDTGYLFGNWDVRNFNTGEYEIVLHAVCSTLGRAEPGVDESWSKPISGTIQLVDSHRVIQSSYPPNMGKGFVGEEISATFNMPVGCDKDNGSYWFDVKLTQNQNDVPGTYYTIFCEDRTVYIKPTGNGVSGCLWLVSIEW
jgi:hypothetical protein